MNTNTAAQNFSAIVPRTLDLTTLTDDQLGMLASYPMDEAHWTLLEDEMTRRVLAGDTDEWTIAA